MIYTLSYLNTTQIIYDMENTTHYSLHDCAETVHALLKDIGLQNTKICLNKNKYSVRTASVLYKFSKVNSTSLSETLKKALTYKFTVNVVSLQNELTKIESIIKYAKELQIAQLLIVRSHVPEYDDANWDMDKLSEMVKTHHSSNNDLMDATNKLCELDKQINMCVKNQFHVKFQIKKSQSSEKNKIAKTCIDILSTDNDNSAIYLL